MISLIQRVTRASVTVDGEIVGQIGPGILALVCAQRNDTEKEAEALLQKLVNYRIFPDENGKMNRSLTSINGSLLIVPQFTLAADTNSGTRPSFTPAADPETGKRLYEHFVACAGKTGLNVQTGIFGADMKVELLNDGPVTFWLETKTKSK